MKRNVLLVNVLAICLSGIAFAADPPEYINYQGVLRDANDNPLNDDHDMVFEFFDAETGGSLLLTDSHTAADPPPVEPVTVAGGLFNAHLGGGNVTAGVYSALAETFANETEVWLEINVGGETLSPRVRIISTGYALNTSYLDGHDASFFLDTSATHQTKYGRLIVDAGPGQIGIEGRGSHAGGYFDSDPYEGSAIVGYGSYGISATGSTAGEFIAYNASGRARVGDGDIGIQATGNQTGGYFNTVGIGTSNPTVPLEVAGDTKVSGTIESTTGGFKFPDDSIQGSAALPLVCEEITGSPDCDLRHAIWDLMVENPITIVDADTNTGNDTSMAIGTDGNPVISYSYGGQADLRVAHCEHPTCAVATVTTLDSVGLVGRWTSIAIGADGKPVISYGDYSNGKLKVAHCDNTACTSATLTTISGTQYPLWTSIAIGSDGYPVISYEDDNTNALKVVKCNDTTCSTSSVSTPVPYGGIPSMVIGSDGNPMITYTDGNKRRIAHCDDPSCTTATSYLVDGSTFGPYAKIAMGADGKPLICYYEHDDDDLRVAHCDDAGCTTSTINTVDSQGDVGYFCSIAIGTDGNPVVSYQDLSVQALKLAECTDAACSSAIVTPLDYEGHTGRWTSTAVVADGSVVVAYSEWNGAMKILSFSVPAGVSKAIAGTSVDAVGTIEPLSERPQFARTSPEAARLVESTAGIHWIKRSMAIRTDDEGNVYARSFRPSARDLATDAQIAERVEPGDVLVIDPQRIGLLTLSRVASDSAVFGIVADEPGVILGARVPTSEEVDEAKETFVREGSSSDAVEQVGRTVIQAPVAVSGVAVCKVDAGYGAVLPGDLLTTSSTPGHAMLAHEPRPGTILGKALEPLDSGTGMIKVLVMLR